MKFVFRYLREHISVIILWISFVCIFAVIFRLYHLPVAAVLYPAFICLLISCLFAGYSIYKAYRKHKNLNAIQSLPGNVIQNEFSENVRIEDQDYQQIISNLCGELQSLEAEMAGSRREMIDYYTMWVHQIKTPIASMRLHLDAEDSQLSRKLTSDLLHIEQYVDMVLTYLRMGADSNDYVFHEIALDDIIKENIRKLRGDFIMKKISLRYAPFNETVITDEKWLSFVVGQILSNALKYTKEGLVEIFMEKPKTLCIRDTGIGISPEDIPRIFEQGYTGYNGREDKRASGIGLYLCKSICDRLGHVISVSSEVEAGTTVRIDLGQSHSANF